MFKSTEKNKANRDLAFMSVVAGILAFYFSLALGAAVNMEKASGVFDVMGKMNFNNFIKWFNPINVLKYSTGDSILTSIWFTLIIVLILIALYLDGRKRNYDMKGIEQGEAQWTINAEEEKKAQGGKYKEPALAKKYRETMMSKDYTDNIMFDNTYGLSMDTRKTRKNLHMLVVGGSGAGKTRFFIKPNMLQMNSSYIITDPSGELYRDMGQMLKDNNYDVRVFNIFDPNMSMQYNPLAYIRSDADVTNLVTTLIKNTGEASGDNKYFDDATKLLLSAIILFLIHYCPKSEHDFAHVMKLVVAADVPEGVKNPQSDLDKIFEQVRIIDPHGLALKMYDSFKSTSGKSLKSVLSSTATRLTVFNYAEIERLTCADTISLTTVGDEKTALFIITPPTDNGFNFLVAMMYSQLFSTLYYHATFECQYLLTDNNYIARPFTSKESAKYTLDLLTSQHKEPEKELIKYVQDDMTDKYEMIEVSTGKVLLRELREETVIRFKENPSQFTIKQNTKEEAGSPFHIRMLMDEFSNINEIPGFTEVLSTIRKYNVSIVIVLQSLSQLKKRYEKDYESIIDNCDTFVFLGSKGQETTEYVSKMLGNRTITVRNSGESMGKNRSSSYNYSQTKRELMTPHELVMLSPMEQIVIVKSVYPFKIPKFDLEKHPNFSMCADADSSKKLIIHKEFNLEKKLAEYNEKHGIKDQRENQYDINQKAQRPVDNWMDKPLKGRTSKQEDEKQDEFEFF